MASSLATQLLALLLQSAHPGQSVYSMEPLPACGSDAQHPACALSPICDVDSPLCSPPHWSPARHAWVRVESRDAAARRFAGMAEALARTATYLSQCRDESGIPDEGCKPINWVRGTGQDRDLALAGLTVILYESGGREDILSGYPPMGRGKSGEACAMQIMPSEIRNYVTWLSPEELKKATDEELAQSMLGADAHAQAHCYEVGLRMLARARSQAVHRCKSTWTYSMFALYGTGSRCDSYGVLGDFAAMRQKTFLSFRNKKPEDIALPEWAVSLFPGRAM